MTPVRYVVSRTAPLFLAAFVLGGIGVPPAPASAQQDFLQVEVRTVPVAPGVWMLLGSGGNVGIAAGEDGVFLIDDQYAPLTERIRAAVRELGFGDVDFVLNTHWHGDHTGGNENLGDAGVLIVAHDNVRERMSVDQFLEAFGQHVPASPEVALPVVTFSSDVTFHLNGDHIQAVHAPHAHTDGDAIVHFPVANAVHMGDVFFNGGYPFVDLGSGGSVDGVIAAVERVLTRVNHQTKVIPGHGPLTDRGGLAEYRDMLVTIRNRIREMVQEDVSLDEVQAARPTSEFDERWGGGFVSAERFVETVYRSVGGGGE